MFKKLFGRKDETPAIQAPEIIGLRLGGAFELDDLRLRLIEPELIIEGASRTHLIQAVGQVKLDATTTVLRFYTDDDAFLQVLLDGGMTENHIADVKLWYFYETKGVAGKADWDSLLSSGISTPTQQLEGHTFERVWNTTGETSKPVAMSEETTGEDGSISETDQFAMLYERQIREDFFEYMMIVGEEKIIDNRADHCVVYSTGFDVKAADITIIG